MNESIVLQIYSEFIETKKGYNVEKIYKERIDIFRDYEDFPEELLEAIKRYNNFSISCILVKRKINCYSLRCGSEDCSKKCYQDMLNSINTPYDVYSRRRGRT